MLNYKTQTSKLNDVYLHLLACNYEFIPPLDQKVNIEFYSKKIIEKAITFEAWVDKQLVGLIAAYFNDKVHKTGYITNVSITKEQKGKGVASQLMGMCIEYAKQHEYTEIKLEVFPENIQAKSMYKKFGFVNTSSTIKDMEQMKLTIK